MKLGVIADIHSNAAALEAVLADLDLRGVDRIVHLGDAFNGALEPHRVLELLRARPMVHVRGNGERMVLSPDPAVRSASASFARAQFSPEELEWIAGWPVRHDEPEFVACHGSPRDDLEYLLEEVTAEGVALRSRADIRARLPDLGAGLVLCGHTHVPRMVRLDDRMLVVNPGSIGLPAYGDETPFPHRMETGSPDARYAVAELRDGAWRVDLIGVPYDWAAAARLAELNGFPEWVGLLSTGYAR